MEKDAITVIIRKHLEKVQEAIKVNMDAYGRNASGRSVKSLNVKMVTYNHGWLEGLRSYWVMERGRKAGRVPKNFRDIIRQWILDKGISVRRVPYLTNRKHKYTEDERSLRILAGAIAYKIMTSGTRLHRQQGFDDIFTSAIDKELAELETEATLVIGVEIDRIHQNA